MYSKECAAPMTGSSSYTSTIAHPDRPWGSTVARGPYHDNRGATGIDEKHGRLHAGEVVRRDDAKGLAVANQVQAEPSQTALATACALDNPWDFTLTSAVWHVQVWAAPC
jgi:hypothetical protein